MDRWGWGNAGADAMVAGATINMGDQVLYRNSQSFEKGRDGDGVSRREMGGQKETTVELQKVCKNGGQYIISTRKASKEEISISLQSNAIVCQLCARIH
jgi:hypothetical protein